MIDPSLHTAACIAFEKAINTALRYDPATRLALSKLAGKVLAIDLTAPSLSFYLVPQADAVSIVSQYEGEVTTRIKGTPVALASLLRTKQLNLAESGVEVFGSTALLIELAGIMAQLDIDWEEALNDVLGDVVGHNVAESFRSVLGWAAQRKDSVTRLLGEYLTEELRGTPARQELNQFYDEVDQLRLATDRLAAKIAQLKDSSRDNSTP